MSPDPDDATIPLQFTLAGVSAAAKRPALVLAVLLILFLAGALLTAGKISVLTRNKVRMEKLAEEGDSKAQKFLRVTADTARSLSAAKTGAALCSMLAAAAAAAAFSDDLAGLLSFLPFSPPVVGGISVFLIVLLLFCFWIVFADLVPKKIALSHAETLSPEFTGALSRMMRLFQPVSIFLSWCAILLARLFGAGSADTVPSVTEEEILLMMEAGRKGNVLNENEEDMISNIFEFRDTDADEAMTHRTDVVAVEDTDSVADVVQLSMENGYSRIPVFHDDLDHVVGVIYVKDLLPYVGGPVSPELSLEQLMRPAYFVPKSKSCGELFSELRLRRIQIAVVVDEYGGTEGIITMEDLLEAIVGNIQDEFDHEEEEVHRDGENRFDVEGTAPVDEVSDLLGIHLPEGDYDTIAGLMMEHLGRLPHENEHPQVSLKGLTLTVAAMEERRISRVLIEKDASAVPARIQPGENRE